MCCSHSRHTAGTLRLVFRDRSVSVEETEAHTLVNRSGRHTLALCHQS